MPSQSESSSAGKATRKGGSGASSMVGRSMAYPVGAETGLPLIICPLCGKTRVIELRVKQETRNKGRSFFKCPRNLCFYKFQKDYFNVLVDMRIIRISCEKFEALEDEEIEDTEAGGYEEQLGHNQLGQNLEKQLGHPNLENQLGHPNLEKQLGQNLEKQLGQNLEKQLGMNLEKMLWTMNCAIVCLVIVVLGVVVKSFI